MAGVGFGVPNQSGGFAFKVDPDGNTQIGDEASDVLQITGSMYHNGPAVFNEGSIDADFRVESNHATHMFYIDGGTNRIGVGNNSPQNLLDIIDPFNDISGHERDAVLRLVSKKSVGIKLVADTDNTDESDNPFIDFYADGNSDTSGRNNRKGSLALEDVAGTTFTGSLADAFFMDAYYPLIGHSSRPLQIANASTNGGHAARITLEGTNGYVGIHTNSPAHPLEVSGNAKVVGTTTSQFYATEVAEQDLGSGTSSTLTVASGTMLLDADSINGQDMGGYEVHGLAIPRGSTSGTRLTLIVKTTTNNVMILPSGIISGTFGSLSDATGVTSLEFAWVVAGTHQAWHQV